MENLSEYLVKNPKLILSYLKTLATEKCLLVVNFGENFSFLTVILDIDEKKQIITIDCGPKEYLNKKLLSAGVVNLKSDLGGIKVLFDGRDIKKTEASGQKALSIRIPKHIYWIQRRKFYRVRSPLSKNSYCSIVIPKTEENKETHNYKLYDLSATGFAIISDTEKLAEHLAVETQFNNCELIFNSTETHTISFIVRSKLALNPTKPNKGHRIGCEVLDISPKVESAFLRYMQDIERALKRNQK